MNALTKRISELEKKDLEELLRLKIKEGQAVEYKRRPWGRNDREKLEMLKDVTGFANASGGRIFVGIGEDEKDTPNAILGILEAPEERERILSLCLSCIENRIAGLDIQPIPVSDKRDALVIHIPMSMRKPHMITYKARQEFWRRHGAQNTKMTVDEIWEAFTSVEHVRKAWDDFIQERRSEFLEKTLGQPWFKMSATPPFLREEILDVFDPALENLMKNPPSSPLNAILGQYVHASLHGLVSESQGYADYSLEILRNGHVEFQFEMSGWVTRTAEDDDHVKHLVLDCKALVDFPLSVMEFFRSFVEQFGLLEPLVVNLRLYNISGWGLDESPSPFHRGLPPSLYKKKHLELLPMRFPSFEKSREITKKLTDRIWNAFGYRRSPFQP